jgi:hypothetical protein
MLGSNLKSNRQVVSKGQLGKMPQGHYGIQIMLELGPPGDYEIVVCFTPIKPIPVPPKKHP